MAHPQAHLIIAAHLFKIPLPWLEIITVYTSHRAACPLRAASFSVQVLLLDEITVDLDVLGRADLMQYLVEETEQRKATIVYVRPL